MSTKISQLTSATDVTASDLIQIVDVEDGVMAPSGTNKKVTASLLAKELAKQPLEPGIVISGSSSGDAVRITQTGAGNAIVVEDSTNPDSTPFVVTGNGDVGIGTSSPSVKLDVAGFIQGGRLIIANGAAETYRYLALDTNSVPRWHIGVSDDAESGSNAGSNFFLHRLSDAGVFLERVLHISRATGNVGIGTVTPISKLHVAGDLTMSSATVATSATAGTNGDVPAQVAGYLVVNINGTSRKIPYYA